MTIEHKSLSWFRPLRGGNSRTSSGLILNKTGVTRGEQTARKVLVLKGVIDLVSSAGRVGVLL
jgi:hypothetical protein